MTPQDVDLIIESRWVVPVAPQAGALEGHCVVVDQGRIVAVAETTGALSTYRARQQVTLPGHALIPGLINLHTHAAMTLMRGMADDLALMRWLNGHIWPAEAKHAGADFVRDGTLLACAEMLRGGVTCFNEMYFFPESAARAALDAGMRAVIGMITIEFPTRYAADPDDYLAKGLAARDALKGEPLLSFCFAPHAPYTVSDRSLARIVTMAEELDTPIHMHVHETEDEIRDSLKAHGRRPLARLSDLGLLGPRLIAVHAVHLTVEEIELFARQGVSVAHCPSSNLKLASGFSPVAALSAASVNLGLGTDGAASNNRLDMFQEMRSAALLAKAVARDPEAMPARVALRAATLGGAAALGMDREIGSIEPGKSADLCAVDLGALELAPCFDPLSHLVYAAGREHVSHVWVGGEARLVERKLVTLDPEDLYNRGRLWQNALAT